MESTFLSVEDWKNALKAAYIVDEHGRVVGLNGRILYTTNEPQWQQLRQSNMWKWVIRKYPWLEVLNSDEKT